MNVLIVDDSAMMRAVLKDFFQRMGVEIAGEAGNGKAALELNRVLQPDFITMDIDMPVVNGIDATQQIMNDRPVPVVIFSNDVPEETSVRAFSAGAAEVLQKPDLDAFHDQAYTTGLMEKITTVVTQRASSRVPGSADGRVVAGETRSGVAGAASYLQERLPEPGRIAAIVMGASTGGPVAVKAVLGALPKEFPLGIALVQHIEARFAEGYAKWLDSETPLSVRIARDGDLFAPGTVLVAPGDRHLAVRNGQLVIEDGPRIGNQRPAVDLLFQSAAHSLGRRTVGVLLTGMGRDGADGCVALRNAGGYTIVQDRETSFIYGMPRAAFESGGASRVAALTEIPHLLVEVAGVA